MAPRPSPLLEWHEANGARFRTVGELRVPAYYSSPEAEYEALRTCAGLIDCTQESRIRVSGKDALEVLNLLTTADLSALAVNDTAHCYMCNDRGGIIDSLYIHRTDKFFVLHGTGSASARVLAWLQEHVAEEKAIEVLDASSSQAGLEIRGPLSRTVLDGALLDGELPTQKGNATLTQISSARCLVFNRPWARTEGYHINCGMLFLPELWERLVTIGKEVGLLPVGQDAVDILSIEAGIPRLGVEVDEDTTPIEVGALTRVDFRKRKFSGRRALLHSTCGEFSRRLVSLRLESQKVPRPGDPIEYDGTPVGRVTGAIRSPRLDRAVAMGFVDALKAIRGTNLQIRSDGVPNPCVVIDSVIDETGG